MNARTKGRQGFTLLEVLLVIFILGLLATVGIVALSGTREGARIDLTKNVLLKQTVAGAMKRYQYDIGHFPKDSEGGLEALWKQPTFEDETLTEAWHGPYLEEEPKDAWKKSLKYETDDEGSYFTVTSNGPDMKEGTEDDISVTSKREEEGQT